MKVKLQTVLPFLIILVLMIGLIGCASKQQTVQEEPEIVQPDTTGQAAREAAEKAERARLDSIRAAEEAERLRLEEEKLARLEAERKAKASLQTVYFGFDKSNLGTDARNILQANAEVMMQYPAWNVVIEGHCDERGSTEYNLALGERRAAAVKTYYIDYGIDGSKIDILSYGEERPAVKGSNEEAWSKNRRGVTSAK